MVHERDIVLNECVIFAVLGAAASGAEPRAGASTPSQNKGSHVSDSQSRGNRAASY